MRQSRCPVPPAFTAISRCLLLVGSIVLPTLVRGEAAAAKGDSDRAELVRRAAKDDHDARDSVDKLDISVEICDWYGGAAGAASISMDDSFASCRDILNKNGFKGTYYLSGTDQFTEADWAVWRSVHAEGHEVGCHTVSHQSCHILDEAALRWEFSNNRRDIIANLGLRKEDVISFAWPRGDCSPGSRTIASEYFVSARGYHINELEDKDPADFMNLKCLNTPHYHHPAYDPPDYFEKADEAERLGKWVHFVFHNQCPDDGAIGYLATKNLWVAPVGEVAKYIKQRQQTKVRDIVQTDSGVRFTLVSQLDPALFNHELTLKVAVRPSDLEAVLVNGKSVTCTHGAGHIMLNVPPSGFDEIKVMTTGPFRQSDNQAPSVQGGSPGITRRHRQRLVKGDGAVINIWLSGAARLDNLRNHQIKHLFVDIGDTDHDGRIKTPRQEIIQFVRLIESYEKQHAYDFVILPYSEINTYLYRLNRRFRDNFLADYRELIALGFEGVYVDVEPVRKEQEADYLGFLSEVSAICPEDTVLGVYAGSLSDSRPGDERSNEWQWPLGLYQRVAEMADVICIPGYDFNLHSRQAYQTSIRKQIESLCAAGLPCQLMLTVPTHKRAPETLKNALAAYSSEIEKHSEHQFIGVCVFAEWTTIPEEWRVFESGM